MASSHAKLASATWLISNERQPRDRRAAWIVQLVRGDQVVLAAAGGQGFPSVAAAEEFARGLRAALPRATVRYLPTLEQRIAEDQRLAEQRRREEEARRAREEALWEEAQRRAEEEHWTDDDWDTFFEERAGDEDQDKGDSSEEQAEDEDDAPITTRGLEWVIRSGEGRPQAALFSGWTAILSTTGLLRIEDVSSLIEWLRTEEAAEVPILRA